MHLFGHSVDDDYYFALPEKGERDTTEVEGLGAPEGRQCTFGIANRNHTTYNPRTVVGSTVPRGSVKSNSHAVPPVTRPNSTVTKTSWLSE